MHYKSFKLSHDLCILVTLQQGQVQVLPSRFGHESGEGHERSVTSTGLTNQTAAQERNGLCGTLKDGEGGVRKEKKKQYYYPKRRALTPAPDVTHHLLNHLKTTPVITNYPIITLQHHQLTVHKAPPPLVTVATPVKLSIHSTKSTL